MNTKLLKKHPIKTYTNHDGSTLFVVKYDLARVGYKSSLEAQMCRFAYCKDRYG